MNVRLKRDFSFTAGIYYNNRMHMNNYNLRLWMVTNSYDLDNHNIAFERLKYFIYNEIDSTVFINNEYIDAAQKFVNSGIKITTLPGEPVDQLIGIMLYYKLNAIIEDRMIIVETELSSVMGDTMTYLHSAEENSDGIKHPDWWTSADIVHCDSEILQADNVVAMHQASAWRELDLAWGEDKDPPSSDNTVVFADFKRDDTK